MPVIILDRQAELKLTAWAIVTGNLEFSGLGLIERKGADRFHVVDVFLLGVGSEIYTEFNHGRQRALGNDPRLKLWFHRHPIGSGNPGDPGNWSGTDESTATREPMGVDPRLVQWSVAIVRTPGGWVGRIDLHVPTTRTFHCAVEPRFPTPETVEEAMKLITPELEEYVGVLLQEFNALRAARVPQRSQFFSRYEFDGREAEYDDWMMDPREYQASGYYCAINECASLGAELVPTEVEYASEGVEIEFYQCPHCGQFYYRATSNDALELPDSDMGSKSQPAWRQSFMNFWKRRQS